MVGVELVTPAAIAGLACPYCGRAMPRDADGMRAAQSAWGLCGASANANGHLIGLLLLAPSELHGRAAARITSAWVAPQHCGNGVGRALLRTVAGGLAKARITLLLAGAKTRPNCSAPPAGFLAGTGFVAQPGGSLWALDLGTTVRVFKPSVLDRLGRLVQSVGPLAPPEPAHNQAEPLR
ncbi:MAG: GNAT family N-acetyltransferase [Micropruina sp.]|nr:GNAT family N-acetyltransferase [Micropruina sp.]